MKKRSRAHEAGSIEAGSSISKSIFFANRVDGAVVGAFACNQIDSARAPRSALGSQIGPVGAPRSAKSSPRAPRAIPKHPKIVPRAVRSALRAAQSAPRASKSAPRASQDRPGTPQERPIEAAKAPRSAQSTQIEATKATLTKHCPCAAKSTKTLPMRSKIGAQECPGQPD